MKIFIIALVGLMSQAFAADYERVFNNFTISDRADNGTRVYYNCDSVEYKVERVLEKMGANVHSVRCTGGLDRWNGRFNLPASVLAVYDVISSDIEGEVATQIADVTISEFDQCHLYNSTFIAVKSDFEISEYDLRRCWDPGSRTLIKMSVLKAK